MVSGAGSPVVSVSLEPVSESAPGLPSTDGVAVPAAACAALASRASSSASRVSRSFLGELSIGSITFLWTTGTWTLELSSSSSSLSFEPDEGEPALEPEAASLSFAGGGAKPLAAGFMAGAVGGLASSSSCFLLALPQHLAKQ